MPYRFVYTTDESKITELAGVTLRAYYGDLRTMVGAQERANAEIGRALDEERSGHVLSRGHVLDAEVMGCAVAWPEDEEPMVAAPALAGREAIRTFRPPDPPDNPVVRRELALARAFFELTGVSDPIGYNGPVSVAAHCLGQAEFFALAAEDTGLAEELVRRVNDAAIAWARYHNAELQLPAPAGIGLADDSASFLSPRLFARLSLPYLQAWYAAHPTATRRFLHICGNTNHLLAELARLDLGVFDMGEMVDLRRAHAAMPGTHLSRIIDFRLVRDGDAAGIAAYVETQLAAGVPPDRLTIKMEGWRGVPLWKARVVKDTVGRWR